MVIKRTFGTVTTASIPSRRGSYALRAAVALTLAMAAQGSFAGSSSFVRRTADPAAQAANVAQQQAVGAAQATQAAMRSLQSFNRLKDVRQNLLTVQEAARAAAQTTSTGVANGLQVGGLQVVDGALSAPVSPTLDVTKTWSGANAPTQTQANGRTQVEIVQTDSKAILTWNTFNVGRETDVHFNQTAGGDQATEWIALNRVTDPNARPSTILGSIKAEGQVYLINTNGILFGATSQVNVHSLIASSLDLAPRTYSGISDPTILQPLTSDTTTVLERNKAFEQGILSNTDSQKRPLVAFGEVLKGASKVQANEIFANSDGVTVQAGARIATDELGSTMLFGHSVINEGEITATDGQVILSAGRSIYLAKADQDSDWAADLRGALVAVDRGGTSLNSGIITSTRGNITLNGKTVVNDGLLEATTAALANGSIRLFAGEFVDTRDLRNYDAFSAYDANPGDLWFGLETDGSNLANQLDTPGGVVRNLSQPLFSGSVILGAGSALAITPDRIGGYVPFSQFSTSYSYATVGAGLVSDYAKELRAYLERESAGFGLKTVNGIEPSDDEIRSALPTYLQAQATTRQAQLLYDFTLGDKAIGDSQFRSSRLEIVGLNVTMNSGATILAPSARVKLSATPASPRQIFDISMRLDDTLGPLFLLARAPLASRLYIDRAALIDVGGLSDVELPMESNIVQVGWRLNELRDSPVQRDSFLHAVAVPVDIRTGNQIADLSAYYALRQRGVPELMTVGGTLTLDSPEIIARAGSTIDLSGGSVRYQDGYAPTVRLLGADGRPYNLTTASANQAYVGYYGEFDVAHARWGVNETFSSPLLRSGLSFQTGYVEGKNAGTLQIGDTNLAPVVTLLGNSGVVVSQDIYDSAEPRALHLDGQIVTNVQVGPYQTERNSGIVTLQNAWRQIPQGAIFKFGPGDIQATGGRQLQFAQFLNGDVPISNYLVPVFGVDVDIGSVVALPDNFSSTDPLIAGPLGQDALRIDQNLFRARGFNQVFINAGTGTFTIQRDATLNLGDYGQFTYAGGRATINGDIVAPNGQVRFDTRALTRDFLGLAPVTDLGATSGQNVVSVAGSLMNLWSALPDARRPLFQLGTDAQIDVSGRWSNETSAGAFIPHLAINGGAVSIASAGDILLREGARIDVSGGGHLSTAYRLTPGNAGSLALSAAALPFPIAATNRLLAYSTGADGNYVGDKVTADNSLRGRVQFDAEFRAFGLGAGGAITLEIPDRIVVGDSALSNPSGFLYDQNTAHIGSKLFDSYGLASFTLGTRGDLEVAANATVQPQVDSFIWNTERAPANGADLYGALAIAARAPELSQPISLSLRNADFSPGRVSIGTNAALILGPHPQSAVSLIGFGGVFVDGTISVPGGSINVVSKSTNDSILFDPSARETVAQIALGPQARLFARGAEQTTLTAQGISRNVLAGGAITLSTIEHAGSDPGYGSIEIDPLSVIDVSGIAGAIDVLNAGGTNSLRSGATDTLVVGGNAGSIDILMPSSTGSIGGSLLAQPGSATAMGGRISISANSFTLTELEQRADGSPVFPSILSLVHRPVTDYYGSSANTTPGALLNASRLRDSGADTIALSALNSIVFSGDTLLGAHRELSLLTPTIGLASSSALDSTIEITAPHVLLGGVRSDSNAPTAALYNAGHLRVSGNFIDLLALQLGNSSGGLVGRPYSNSNGFADAQFFASSDIRFSGSGIASGANANTNAFNRIFSSGAIVFESAQAYASSGSVTRVVSNESIVFRSNGGPAPVPYSFGGALNVEAPIIEQQGILRAPLGRINLSATKSLVLATGSVTSVSAEGLLIPLGSALGGDVPVYDGGAAAAPDKSIELTAPIVTVADRSVLDVSGGGDLYSYEFTSGNGGSNDILNQPGMYAVLPGYLFSSAPSYANGSAFADSSLRFGQSVYLAGSDHLAAGEYVLLPAHFALLPGGVAIQRLQGGYAELPSAEMNQADGSSIVGGYGLLNGSSTRDPLFSEYRVLPQDTVREYSQYNDIYFNKFATERAQRAATRTPRLPVDGGSLVINAAQQLILNGVGRFSAPIGARAGSASIVATNIAVISAGNAAPTADYLVLDATALNAFGADSLILGAKRTGTDTLSVGARNVYVANDVSSTLRAPEIILAATEQVTVTAGSALAAEGGSNEAATQSLTINGNGAAVVLSSNQNIDLLRVGGASTQGDLIIQKRASLSASGALVLDASRAVSTASSSSLRGASLSLASSQVSLGDAPIDTPGTILGSSALTNLSAASDLRIRSYSSIGFYGQVALGGMDASSQPTAENITLDAAALIGHGDSATIAARHVTLSNSSGAVIDSPTGSGGTLKIVIDTLSLASTGTAPNGMEVGGFARTEISAPKIVVQDEGALHVRGDLAIATDLLTATAASDYRIESTNALTVAQRTATAATAADLYGGRVRLNGASISIDTRIDAAAGVIEAHATQGALTVGAHAVLSARGVSDQFFDVTKSVPAGRISLSATGGDLSIAQGSVLDVSSKLAGTDGGRIDLNTDGIATVAGNLEGAGANGFTGAAVAIEARQLGDFTALNRELEASSFNAERNIHVREGNLQLANGETLTAHRVTLQSDNGDVSVAGTVQASGTQVSPDGGHVSIVAGRDVHILQGAMIDASAATVNAANFPAQSGRIDVASLNGLLEVQTGTTLRTTGGARNGGVIAFGAPRTGNDVAITQLAGTLEAREILVRGTTNYAATAVDAARMTQVLNDAGNWLTNAAAIQARLGHSVNVNPGVRFESAGDLSITAPIDLHTLNRQGDFTFAANNDVLIDANISDGFANATLSGALLNQVSSSLHFTAGRDVVVGANRIVRTGTGDISITAGRDILLGGADTANINWAVYTAGRTRPTNAAFNRVGRVGDYATEGGDITLNAGRDIRSPVFQDYVTAWQFRYGLAGQTSSMNDAFVLEQSSWSVVFPNVRTLVGAVGGGNADIHAGGDISDLSVAVPTTGYQITAVGAPVSANQLITLGGGNLRVRADDSIYGGLFTSGRGLLEVSADGQLFADQFPMLPPSLTASDLVPTSLSALFAVGDTAVTIRARADLEIGAVLDGMKIGQITDNIQTQASYFSSYTARSSLNATSIGGELRYADRPDIGVYLTNPKYIPSAPGMQPPNHSMVANLFDGLPSQVMLTAMQSDVIGHAAPQFNVNSFGRGLALAPSALGTLDIFAADTIDVANIAVKDIAAEHWRTAIAPFMLAPSYLPVPYAQGGASMGNLANNFLRGDTLLHAADFDPIHLYARDGDINYLSINAPKPLQIRSGRDITLASLSAQNNRTEDLILIAAGRDLNVSGTSSIYGPGSATFIAGRDVSLGSLKSTADTNLLSVGNGVGIVGALNGVNSALPKSSTALSILAGAGVNTEEDYLRFANVYFDPLNSAGVARTYLLELRTYLLKIAPAVDVNALDDKALLNAFLKLPVEQQAPLLQQVLFTELKETGIDANEVGGARFGSYARGRKAIELMFPAGALGAGGNVRLFGNRVETDYGGQIDVLAPYGAIALDEPGHTKSAQAGKGGVVTRGGGAIHMLTERNIDVVISRIFTLQGGDITLWSSSGDITAGDGGKAVVSNPPPLYRLDDDAFLSLDVFGLQTGSGIGVLDALGTGGKKGRIDLIAPEGTVDAGEAGIRVQGDINIAALHVANADNIQASGKKVGIPEIAAVNTAALAAASSAAAGVSDAAEQLASRSQPNVRDLPSIITVEVLGFGDGP